MLTELDVVNACLATMGEAPLTALNIPHPYVQAALQKLRLQNVRVHARNLWFTYGTLTVTPDPVTGDLGEQLPCGTVQVWSKEGISVKLENNTLVDLTTSEVIYKPREIHVRRELAFLDLPMTVQQYVHDVTVERFQSDFDGDADKGRKLEKATKDSFALMMAEDIRTQRANLLFGRASTLTQILYARGQRLSSR